MIIAELAGWTCRQIDGSFLVIAETCHIVTTFNGA